MKKKNSQNAKKAVLSALVAFKLISTGAYAETRYIDVQMNDGIARFDTKLMIDNGQYKKMVQDALKDAFAKGETIVIKDTKSSNWIDFGGNTKAGVTYADLVAGAGSSVAKPVATKQWVIDTTDKPVLGDLIVIGFDVTALQVAIDKAETLLNGDVSEYNQELLDALQSKVDSAKELVANFEEHKQSDLDKATADISKAITDVEASDHNYS